MDVIVQLRIRDSELLPLLDDREFMKVFKSKALTSTYIDVYVNHNSKSFDRAIAYDKVVQEATGESVLSAWISTKSTPEELAASAYVLLECKYFSATSAREFGTLYDDQHQCKYCGINLLQNGPLFLDKRAILKRPDVFTNLTNDIVVKESVAIHLERYLGPGWSLRDVYKCCVLGRAPELLRDSSGHRLYQIFPETFPFQLSTSNVYWRKTLVYSGPPNSECPLNHTVDETVYGIPKLKLIAEPIGPVVMSETYFMARPPYALSTPYRMTLIRNDLYRHLAAARFKGFEFTSVEIE